MACTDKILKWTLVGVQGALLSRFIEPIYLDGIIVSRFFRPRHLKYHLFDRLDERSIAPRLNAIAPQFKIQAPRFGYYDGFSEDQSKLDSVSSCLVAHNWQRQLEEKNPKVEVTLQATGLQLVTREPSRLSKRSLFGLFLEVRSKGKTLPVPLPCLMGAGGLLCLHRMEIRQKEPTPEEDGRDESPRHYGDMKEAATDYQGAWSLLRIRLEDNRLGTWVGMPEEVDDFTIREV